MKLLDIVNGPWAIMPDKLEEICGIYRTHLRGEKIDIKAIEARIGQPLQNEPQGYTIEDGVAIVPVHGVISKKANLLHQISGGASTALIRRDIANALNDPAVESIILSVDSPGGSVDGTQELAEFIYNSRGEKPITAIVDGTAASAAYWIAAASDRIEITSSVTNVGSIGVIAQHTDTSKQDKKSDVVKTTIFAGKYKDVASPDRPLSDEDKATIQERVDYLYSIFVGDVAKFRGVSTEEVLENMADGRIFIGKQAVEAGLVDGVSTLDAAIERMAGGALPGLKIKQEEEIAMSGTTDKNTPLTLVALKADHPELVEAILAEGHATGYAEGLAFETARVKDVFAASLPGHEKLIQALMFDGKTTGGEAALQVMGAERSMREGAMNDMQNDAKDLDKVGASADGGEAAAEDLTTEEGRIAAWDKASAKTKAEFNNDIGAFHGFYGNIDKHRTLGGSK